MKKFILKIAPQIVIEFYLKYVYTQKVKQFSGNTPNATFKEIYKSNHWNSNESVSGTGSDIEETKTIIKEINNLIVMLSVKTILDIPCGDFNWMQKVNLGQIKYVGADIVDELVNSNNIKYSEKYNVDFVQRNLINDPLPKCDMIINRDCLVHLSFEDIFKSMQNIKSSGCTYLLTTTFPRHTFNYDIETGYWRPINLEKSPFNLPKPLMLINENYAAYKELKDKSLGLWLIDDLKLPGAKRKWWSRTI